MGTEQVWTREGLTEADFTQFEQMSNQARKRAYNVALQLTRSPIEAEDLVQETMIKAWKGYSTYTPGRPFLNWMLRIMQRAYLDMRRRDNPIRKAESLSSFQTNAEGEYLELHIPDFRNRPDDLAEENDLREAVTIALKEIPEVYRQAIVCCDIHQMSYGEIAELQKTTIGTVRSRIHRGRRMMRDVIQRRNLLSFL